MSIEGWQGEIHAAAELFPLMEGEEFESLVASIKEQGLRESIWVTADGQLLDGRNRVRACHAAGIEPRRRTFSGGDPVAFVMALNMDRRHLTVGQRALIALKLVPMYEAEAAKRQGQRSDLKPNNFPADLQESSRQRESTHRAGAAAKVSGRAVAQAKRVAENAPDLVAKIESGKLALDRADRIVRDRDSAEKRAAKATAQQKQIAVGTSVDVRHGDFRKVLSDLQDVDAIITDPPYPREFLPMLDDLRDFADKVLAPDGVLVVLFGQTYLPEVYRRLEGGRPYRWTGCYLTPGAGYASMAKRVQSNWKPVIVYGGGQRFGDVFRSEGADVAAKSYHHWGQDYSAFAQIVERLTMPGATVVDPFMGSGTTLLAAQALGRHAIGCDIDNAHVETAKERLNA